MVPDKSLLIGHKLLENANQVRHFWQLFMEKQANENQFWRENSNQFASLCVWWGMENKETLLMKKSPFT